MQERSTIDVRRVRGLVAAVAVALASCGGGGSSPSTTVAAVGPAGNGGSGSAVVAAVREEPSGIYGARVEGFSSPSMLYFAQNNELPFALLGEASPTGFTVKSLLLISPTGATWTPATEPGWVYNSYQYPSGPDFGRSVIGYSVSASHLPGTPSLAGTMSRSSGAWRFDGGRVEHSDYDFNAPLPVSKSTGHWELHDLSGGAVVLDIDAQGRLSGSYQGCALSGSVLPSAGGKGYLSLSLLLDGATCPTRPDTAAVPYRGFVVAYPLTSGMHQMVLYGMAQWEGPNFPAADSVLAVGVR